MINQLDLDMYRSAIRLDEPFTPPTETELKQADREQILDELIVHLCKERNEPPYAYLDEQYSKRRSTLEGLLTVRSPGNFPEKLMQQLDRLLAAESLERQVHIPLASSTSVNNTLKPILWQGDITSLKVGAIVNAANSGLLGCFQPFHKCIDNIIHDKAGPRLRQDCATIIDIQGEPEMTGGAKITRGYHLPAKYVLHTVGPIVSAGKVNRLAAENLSNCYSSCLDLAARVPGICSIAFCCISTGVFGFPKDQAARTAITSVKNWLHENPDALDTVVFNVFSDEDYKIYEEYLSEYDSIPI